MAKKQIYEEFIEKFKPKKTTDDCYTPPLVYEAVKQWVNDKVMPLEGVQIVRPFYPNGDYQSEEYPEGCLVLDNPPFSILAQIVDWYNAHGIKFFLFAPQLTLFGYNSRPNITAIVASATVTYENGATVSTSFITNAYPEDVSFIVAGDLYKIVHEANKKALNEKKPCTRPKFDYPAHVVVSSKLGRLAHWGIQWKAPRAEVVRIRKLDEGRELFGSGFLISERLAAERLAAERLALSDREWGIIRQLSQ